jgi:hypothetical protein
LAVPLILPGDLPDDDEYDFYEDPHESWCRYPSGEACICDYPEEDEDDGSDYFYADPASDEW